MILKDNANIGKGNANIVKGNLKGNANIVKILEEGDGIKTSRTSVSSCQLKTGRCIIWTSI